MRGGETKEDEEEDEDKDEEEEVEEEVEVETRDDDEARPGSKERYHKRYLSGSGSVRQSVRAREPCREAPHLGTLSLPPSAMNQLQHPARLEGLLSTTIKRGKTKTER